MPLRRHLMADLFDRKAQGKVANFLLFFSAKTMFAI